MILVIFCAISILIVGLAAYNKKARGTDSHSGNPELNEFYELSEAPASTRVKKLYRAAKYMLDVNSFLERQIEVVGALHRMQLVSDDYYNALHTRQSDLLIEKIIIETEAEGLKPGARESFFDDAATQPRIFAEKTPKVKYFDEAIYLKRREQLLAKLC